MNDLEFIAFLAGLVTALGLIAIVWCILHYRDQARRMDTLHKHLSTIDML